MVVVVVHSIKTLRVKLFTAMAIGPILIARLSVILNFNAGAGLLNCMLEKLKLTLLNYTAVTIYCFKFSR